MVSKEFLFKQWVKRVADKSEQLKERQSKLNSASHFGKRYFHFDLPVSEEDFEKWKLDLQNPDVIRKRAFYPFVKTWLIKKRFAQDSVTGKRVKLKQAERRPICFASHQDAMIFSWYAFQISYAVESSIVEQGLSDCILAYRAQGKNNVHFAKETFDWITATVAEKPCVVLSFDVKSFFDKLDHSLLKASWINLLGSKGLPDDHYAIYKAMTRFQFVEEEKFVAHIGEAEFKARKKKRRLTNPDQFRTEVIGGNLCSKNAEKFGIPQGSPLSAVLSNLYMLSADELLNSFAQSRGGIYRRYCDDLLFALPLGYQEECEQQVESVLSLMQLPINHKKTERRFLHTLPSGDIQCVDEKGVARSIQYLGLEFNGRTVRLRPSSLCRYHQRVRRGISRTVGVAFSKKSKSKTGFKVFKRALYERYTHLGKFNFITYAHMAAEITRSYKIKDQCRRSVELVNTRIEKEIERRKKWQKKRTAN